MAIAQTIRDFREEAHMSQKELAQHLHVDNSYLSKIEKETRPFPESLDPALARTNWRLAIEVINHRSGGYIKNRLREGVDIHPSALKELLLKDLEEATDALEAITMATDRETQREQAEKVVKEIDDVLELGVIMKGVVKESFIDRKGGRK